MPNLWRMSTAIDGAAGAPKHKKIIKKMGGGGSYFQHLKRAPTLRDSILILQGISKLDLT